MLITVSSLHQTEALVKASRCSAKRGEQFVNSAGVGSVQLGRSAKRGKKVCKQCFGSLRDVLCVVFITTWAHVCYPSWFGERCKWILQLSIENDCLLYAGNERDNTFMILIKFIIVLMLCAGEPILYLST